jgi:imidazolonepropionase-like amidohydrolase
MFKKQGKPNGKDIIELSSRNFILILLSFIIFQPSILSQATKNANCDLLIKNASLFDGHKNRGIVDIAVRNGSIIWIAKSSEGFTAVETIDGTGKYIVPGLINSHVHLWDQKDLKTALQAGIFAVIDLHSSEGPDEAFRQLRDSANYANYYSAGYAATVPKGHPTQIFPIETINDSVSPSLFVEHRIKKGADLIKIVSGNIKPGSLWYGNPSLDYKQIEQIIKAAKNWNKKTVVHVSQVEETVKIAKMGVDGFAHLWSYNDSATDKQLKFLKSKKVFIIPTALIQKRAWDIIEKNPGGDHPFKGSLSTMPTVYKEIGRLHAAGITIIAGTDPPSYGINHHDDLLEELAIYSKAGLPGEAVLRTATGNPSAAFQLDGIGTINEGQKANFMLLNSDPLASISALKDIDAIWKNGVKVRSSANAQEPSLYQTIARMDSLLFVAFNNCDTAASKEFFTRDLEFYHDKGGLTRFEENMQSIRKRCSSDYKVRRELVPGTMEVFPIKDYGAIQLGSHRFYFTAKGEAEKLDGTFRFVHVWKNENGRWRIARVVSFDH